MPLGFWRLGGSPVVAFWCAYVLTRPLGASFADWTGKEHSIGGGLGYGDGLVTLALLVAIAGLVGWLVFTGRDQQHTVTLAQLNQTVDDHAALVHAEHGHAEHDHTENGNAEHRLRPALDD